MVYPDILETNDKLIKTNKIFFIKYEIIINPNQLP